MSVFKISRFHGFFGLRIALSTILALLVCKAALREPMKIVFLAPGLPRVKRGIERFMSELSGELRKAGLDSVCWGTKEAPGVEEISVPSRIELQQFALDGSRRSQGAPALLPSALEDWSIYCEDQLFAIPAARKIADSLRSGEPLLVYARWQGGFVDPSGAPTILTRTLADAIRIGKASLLVHTDYIYLPIDSILWSAGACFHSLGPWLTEPLSKIPVACDAITELPMCVHAGPYRAAREHRERVRNELDIPQNAFVLLSVGAFETTTPDKRYPHLLAELRRLKTDVWWIVAGARGAAPAAWEKEAQRVLGSRFLPITNRSFEKMPELYGAADLFVLASVAETFGLVYLEAQIAGLPTVIHNSPVTRHNCSQIAEALQGFCLVNMERQGEAASAIAHWISLLTNDATRAATRAALDAFAAAQERRSGWEHIAPQFVAAFDRLDPARSQTSGTRRQAMGTLDEQLHKQGIRLFEEGKLGESVQALGKAVGLRETADRWNDWATAQSGLGNFEEAEQGFRRALKLDASNAQAAANFGAFLAAANRPAEALPLLRQGFSAIDEAQRTALKPLIASCEAQLNAVRPVDAAEISSFFSIRRFDTASESLSDYASLFSELLQGVPDAKSQERILCVGPDADTLAAAVTYFRRCTSVEWRTPASAGELDPVKARLHLESSPWPLADATFDVVILAAALESVISDPMLVMAEVNRILKPGGKLLLTASNIASARSLHALMRGGTPYVDALFKIGDAPSLPHREYTAGELEALVSAAGFNTVQIRTKDIRWQLPEALLPSLAALGFAIGSRGDTLILEAQKASAVRDRFPSRLYDLRSLQSGKAMPAETARPMRILVTFETVPLLDGGGADHRLMQIIRLLCEQGHAVTFLAPRNAATETCEAELRQLGVKIRVDDAEVRRLEGADIMPKWTLQELLREGQFDLAILSLWFWMGVTLPEHYLDEIRRLSPQTRIAILTDDCHGIREEGSADLSGLWSERERAADFTEREMEMYRRSDLVIAISDADKKVIGRGTAGKVPVEILPMMIEQGPVGPGFDEREGIVYFGHYKNPPSLDGLEWYLREVAPLVRQELPDLDLYLLGAGLPETWTPPDQHVISVGFRLDLAPEFAKRRFLISPVRFGTGVKTKNLHALAHGLPIVTNTKGADGANFIDGETALIADDPHEFAAAVVNLYRDSLLWAKLSENSRAHAAKYFSKDAMDAALRRILALIPALTPRPYESSHAWSMRLVEKMYVEVTTFQPAQHRPSIRILAYSRAAEDLLKQGNRDEARRQLRHVFNFISHTMSRTIFFSSFISVAESMERTYRALGETAAAEAFRSEGRRFSASAFNNPDEPTPPSRSGDISSPAPSNGSSHAPSVKSSTGRHSKLDFSVVVPTYNRAEVLAECLAALNAQLMSPQRFEVFVVDDGSTDHTQSLCEAHHPRHAFRYLRQENAGAGAARRLGVQNALGKYVLLINDDTIASRTLLAQHLELQRAHAHEKIAVLGNFSYPDAAKRRALTWFLRTSTFLFPQVNLQQGIYKNHSLFITCNISVRRDAILAAGNFDSDFRVAEDTDLGIRLLQHGLRVLYAPELDSRHQHLDFTLASLLRRAEVYGNQLVRLFKKHPCLLEDGDGLLGNLGASSLGRLTAFLDEHRTEIPAATETLAKFDSIDFTPFFSRQLDGKNAADTVMDLFTRSVPTVYWFHLFRSFLAAQTAAPALTGASAASQ